MSVLITVTPDEIRYSIPGRPVSWKRTNGKNRRWTPDDMRRAKASHALAALAARQQWSRQSRAPWPMTGDFALEAGIYMPDHRSAPDADNAVKLAMDAAEGILYENDRQICDLIVRRRVDTGAPRTVIAIRRLALVAALLLGFFASPARAQERIDDQIALARVCVSEVGFDATVTECAAIAAVLRSRASSIASGAQRYSGRVFDRNRTDPRAYIADLDPSGREPARWPGLPHAPWHLYRDAWLDLYRLAGEIARGALGHVCVAPPDHWGMRSCAGPRSWCPPSPSRSSSG